MAVDSRGQNLHKLLEHHQPADPSEQAFKRQMLELLRLGAGCFDRSHYVPGHFTASAFVLDPSNERLLLIHHKKLDRWLQPGGHIEPGDTNVIEAARREATEETGLLELTLLRDGLFDIDIHEIPAHGGAPSHLHFDVRLLFRASTDAHRIGAEVHAARWVPLQDITHHTDDSSVRRAVAKLH